MAEILIIIFILSLMFSILLCAYCHFTALELSCHHCLFVISIVKLVRLLFFTLCCIVYGVWYCFMFPLFLLLMRYIYVVCCVSCVLWMMKRDPYGTHRSKRIPDRRLLWLQHFIQRRVETEAT
jgi:hypothetical protein